MELAVDINVWAYAFYAITLIFSSMNLFHVFFGNRRTSFGLWVLSFIVYSVCIGLIFLYLNVVWVTSLSALMGKFLLSFNYKATMPKRIAGVLGNFLTVFSLELVIVVLFGHNLQLGESTDSVTVVTLLVLGVSIYLITLFLRRFKNIVNLDDLPKSTYVIHFFVPFTSAALLYSATYLPLNMIPYFVIALFLMNVIFFYFQDQTALAEMEKRRIASVSQEREYYFAQNELMVETVEKVKGIRHDVKLHLATLESYIKNNSEEALAYIGYLVGDVAKSEVYSDTGNISLDSIINFKLSSAKDLRIELDIFAPAEIGIENHDIVTIVGNLLDNALEAVRNLSDKFINMQITYQKGNLLIRVENPFEGVVNKDFATLKSGDGHGYGLRNVREAVDKYNGTLIINHDEGVFVVKVMLYSNCKKNQLPESH